MSDLLTTFKVKAAVMDKHQRCNIKHQGCALGKAVLPPGVEYLPLRQLQG